jgi:hypothetical protein
MEPMDITDDSFKKKRKLDDLLNDSSDMELTNSNHANIIQSGQDDAPSEVKLVIHNQCLGTELISPLYYNNVTMCYLSLDQIVYAGSTMQASFNIQLAEKEY